MKLCFFFNWFKILVNELWNDGTLYTNLYLYVAVMLQDQSGDIHYTEFLAATIEAVGATEVRMHVL